MRAKIKAAKRSGRPLLIDRVALIEKLRGHEPELKAVGVLSLSAFGSVARGDDTAASDVDLAVRIGPAARMSLLRFGSPCEEAL